MCTLISFATISETVKSKSQFQITATSLKKYRILTRTLLHLDVLESLVSTL